MSLDSSGNKSTTRPLNNAHTHMDSFHPILRNFSWQSYNHFAKILLKILLCKLKVLFIKQKEKKLREQTYLPMNKVAYQT